MITYAQNFEDVLLARVFRHKAYGFYIDVGAHDPVDLSVTKYFYDLGWRGINIEPVPSNHKRFLEQRPRDINLNMAAGERSGVLTLHVVRGQTPYVADGTALSTFLDDLAPKSAEVMGGHPVEDIQVDVRTLAEICDASCREPVDFLKIDVEGWEKQVLQGADFSKIRPAVIIVEATKPDVSFKGFDQLDAIAGWDDWEPLLLKADYRFAYFDGLNRFYVRAEDAKTLLPLFSLPVGLYDGVQLTNPLWVAPSLKAHIIEEDERYQEACRQVTDAQAAHAELRKAHESMTAALADATVRLAQESDSRESTEADLRAQKAYVESLQNEITAVRTQRDADRRRADTANARAHALAEQISSLEAVRRDIDNRLQAETARANEATADRDARIATITRLTATAATFEETRRHLYQENETFSARVKATGERLLTLERKLADTHAEKLKLEAARQDLLAQADAAQRTLQDKEKAIAEGQAEITRVTSENQTLTTRLAAANQRLSLIRTMARENAFRRRHRLRLALLRWFPPLARLRHAIPEADLNDVSLNDLLNPRFRAAPTRREDKESRGRSSVINKQAKATRGHSAVTITPKSTPKKQRISSRLKISVITPSFNTGDAIEQAITSVLEQGYPNYEHVIIDGGSTDNTLEVLKRHPHLKWVSEKDKGQSDAMNKGFARATGDIIVYLNADDTFLPGAFSAVIPAFEAGAQVVMGRVRVVQEKDGLVWENDPRTDLASMLRHWEQNAFCVNPVGYFYRKAVQEQIPFNLANDDKMDLEFLLDVAARFEIVKVDATLGVFNYALACKTGKEQSRLDYWQPINFPFVNRLAKKLPPDEARRFTQARAIGYQQRRAWTLRELVTQTTPEELRRHPGVVTLPPLGGEPETLVSETDRVIFTLAAAKMSDDAWSPFVTAFPPEIPIRHLRSDADLMAARHFLARSGTRIQPYVIAVADALKTGRGAPQTSRILARLFGQQVPAKTLKEDRPLQTFSFRHATVAAIAADQDSAYLLLPKIAALWGGAINGIEPSAS